MLSRARATRAMLLLVASGGLILTGTTAATAGGPVKCPPGAPVCEVTADDPGHPGHHSGGDGGSGDSGGGGSACHRENGQEIPCSVTGLGSWDGKMCYWLAVDPQPPADDPVWNGHKPSDGTIYHPTLCLDFPYKGAGTFVPRDTFFPKGKGPGQAPTVTPEQVARIAVKSMTLNAPDIGIAPEPGKTGLVGLPVWMWNKKGTTTTGPQTATASAGAVTVTATAKVEKVVWNMGDGSSVTCTKPGTPYRASYGKKESPDCGHLYARTSKGESGNKFKVTATATWTIHWEGGGETGELTQTRVSNTEIAIGELQVLGD